MGAAAARRPGDARARMMSGASAAAVRFVIVAARRTGSNLLCTLVGSHADVLCHHELFNPGGIYYALPLRNGGFSLGTIEERDADPLGASGRTRSASAASGSR
jgi:hypothetical protein